MEKKITWIRGFLLLVSGVFLVVGMRMEQHIDTMEKAIRICLECIGIG